MLCEHNVSILLTGVGRGVVGIHMEQRNRISARKWSSTIDL